MRLRSPLTAAAAAVVSVGFTTVARAAGITADSVVDYTPGTASTSFRTPSAALGPLAGDTGGGNGLNPFDPPYAASQIVIVGAGGQLTLHLSAPAPVGTIPGPTLGVFVNNGIIDTSGGSGVAGNPATTFGAFPRGRRPGQCRRHHLRPAQRRQPGRLHRPDQLLPRRHDRRLRRAARVVGRQPVRPVHWHDRQLQRRDLRPGQGHPRRDRRRQLAQPVRHRPDGRERRPVHRPDRGVLPARPRRRRRRPGADDRRPDRRRVGVHARPPPAGGVIVRPKARAASSPGFLNRPATVRGRTRRAGSRPRPVSPATRPPRRPRGPRYN